MITFLKNRLLAVYSHFGTHDIRQDSFMVSAFIALVAIILGQAVLLGIYYFDFPAVIVMHSNIYFGIDLIGERTYSVVIPSASLVVGIIHSIGIFKLYRFDRELSRLLMGGTLAVTTLFFVNVFFVINLNT